jgi:hypothetical protein
MTFKGQIKLRSKRLAVLWVTVAIKMLKYAANRPIR